MKKYGKLILAAVAFVVFMAVIVVVYTKLSAEYKPEQNMIAGEESSSAQEPEAETSGQEETASEDAASKVPDKPKAMDFTMENAEGEEVTFLSFSGKPIVVNFWASWCGPCKSELPDFQEAYTAYEGEVEFVMVNMTDGSRETKENAAAFWEEEGYTLPIYFDTEQEAAYTYSVYALPTTFFIKADGTIEAGAQGMIDAETLELGISMILEEE